VNSAVIIPARLQLFQDPERRGDIFAASFDMLPVNHLRLEIDGHHADDSSVIINDRRSAEPAQVHWRIKSL